MKHITIKLIANENIFSIIPLLQQLDPGLPTETLQERLSNMLQEGYKCVGAYENDKLIGASRLWIATRYYCGKFIEPDNFIIDENYRNKGIGKKLMDWIYEYGRKNGCIRTELNAYTANSRAHKFYINEGYKILGFRFCKDL